MCGLRNIAMRDYQESVTTGQTDGRTDRQTLDKVIPMCRYASQAKQKHVFVTCKAFDLECYLDIERNLDLHTVFVSHYQSLLATFVQYCVS